MQKVSINILRPFVFVSINVFFTQSEPFVPKVHQKSPIQDYTFFKKVEPGDSIFDCFSPALGDFPSSSFQGNP
jgi:hypothetical protein